MPEENPTTIRTCSKCKEGKALAEFTYNRGQGRYETCKLCTLARQNQWQQLTFRRRCPRRNELPLGFMDQVHAQREEIIKRIARNSRENVSTGCVEWLGISATATRYPRISVKLGDGHPGFGAHRVIAALFHGLDLLNAEHFACHKCDNKICVNPDHIFVGSAADNTRDASQKGRLRGNSARGEERKAQRLCH